jgi:hypothetical protein
MRARLIIEMQTTARGINVWWVERAKSDPSLQNLATVAERKTLLERLDDDRLRELVTAQEDCGLADSSSGLLPRRLTNTNSTSVPRRL